jgi:hypothetical protein
MPRRGVNGSALKPQSHSNIELGDRAMRASSGLLFCAVVGGILSVGPPAFAICSVNGDLFYMHKSDETKHVIKTDHNGCDLSFTTAGKIQFDRAEVVDQPQNGELSKIGVLEFRYVPNRKFRGADAFAVRVCGTTPVGAGCSVLHYTANVR